MTPLDQAAAHLASEDETLRRAYYARLAAAELFLLLDAPAEGDRLSPRVFTLEDGPVVLAFDTEERLAAFAGAAPYAALTGRVLAPMLAAPRLGLGVNLGTDAPSEALLPPEALAWLSEQAVAPQIATSEPETLLPPGEIAEPLLPALDACLAGAGGLARRAILVRGRYAGGAERPVLALIDPAPGAEDALSTHVGEALAIAGIDPAALDLMFLADGTRAERLAATGLTIDLPAPETPDAPKAPGTDPDRPPRLR